MNNKNKKSNLQFTELTSTDVIIHRGFYVSLVEIIPKELDKKYLSLYIDYAVKEVQKSKSLFQKTFGGTFGKTFG